MSVLLPYHTLTFLIDSVLAHTLKECVCVCVCVWLHKRLSSITVSVNHVHQSEWPIIFLAVVGAAQTGYVSVAITMFRSLASPSTDRQALHSAGTSSCLSASRISSQTSVRRFSWYGVHKTCSSFTWHLAGNNRIMLWIHHVGGYPKTRY